MNDTLDDILQREDDTPRVQCPVDGDLVAYRAASAVDGSQYVIQGHVGNWRYKADVEQYCKNNGIDRTLIEQIYEPEPVEHALNICKITMRTIEQAILGKWYAHDFHVYLTHKENFRSDINPAYKENRVEKRRPEHLSACKEYLEKYHGAVYEAGYEADDLMTIKATECLSGDKQYCICSFDKDLKQMPGWHFDWIKGEFLYVTPAEGRENLWNQVISGDSTDSIFTPRGLGPAKAKTLFANVDFSSITDEELYQMATDKYAEFLTKPKRNPCLDTTDVRCWVEQTYHQVFLLRERL